MASSGSFYLGAHLHAAPRHAPTKVKWSRRHRSSSPCGGARIPHHLVVEVLPYIACQARLKDRRNSTYKLTIRRAVILRARSAVSKTKADSPPLDLAFVDPPWRQHLQQYSVDESGHPYFLLGERPIIIIIVDASPAPGIIICHPPAPRTQTIMKASPSRDFDCGPCRSRSSPNEGA